jgi:hypothetical protein
MRRVWFFCVHWRFPGGNWLGLNPIPEVEWPQKGTEGPARQSRNGTRETDRKMGDRKMGFGSSLHLGEESREIVIKTGTRQQPRSCVD